MAISMASGCALLGAGDGRTGIQLAGLPAPQSGQAYPSQSYPAQSYPTQNPATPGYNTPGFAAPPLGAPMPGMTATAPNQAVLGAVEEFLSRTSGYDAAQIYGPPTSAYPSSPAPMQRETFPQTAYNDVRPRGPGAQPSWYQSQPPSSGWPSSQAQSWSPAPMQAGQPPGRSQNPNWSQPQQQQTMGWSQPPPQTSGWSQPQWPGSATSQAGLASGQPGFSGPALPVVETMSVRPGGATSSPLITASPTSMTAQQTPAPARRNTTNQPLNMASVEGPSIVDRFLSYMESEARRKRSFDAEWGLRLSQMALNREGQAVNVSPDMPGQARRILASLAHVARELKSVARNPATPGDMALESVNRLREVVAERADLTINTVAICEKVVTFGVYDEMDANELIAGTILEAIVYAEIGNFYSERTDEGMYRTELATKLEVLESDGDMVWERSEPEIVDECRTRRTDFFVAQRIMVPPTLPAGDYVLKIFVEDKLSGRVAETTRPLIIRSALAAGPPP